MCYLILNLNFKFDWFLVVLTFCPNRELDGSGSDLSWTLFHW